MYETLEVRNWESLVHIKLELGRLTLITGESSSGKSASYRAFQALASNIRGSYFVTVGAKQSSISLSSQDWRVTLERGQGHGVYRIADLVNSTEETFTKLDSKVPARVSEVLRLDPSSSDGGSINFAEQGDPPFLLKMPGAQVARTLGELTNVSRILEAVREANRVRLGVSQDLKTREADLSNLVSQLDEYKDLSAQRAGKSTHF